MPKKLDPEVLTIPPFDFDLGVFRSFAQYEKYFTARGIEFEKIERANAAASRFYAEGVTWHCLILPKGTSLAKQAHEVSHVVDFAMEAAGVPVNVENTEIRAYIMERVLDQLWGK